MLNSALCLVEKEKNVSQSEIGTLNIKLYALQMEKEKIIQSMKGLYIFWKKKKNSYRFSIIYVYFKGECKRAEEKELEFKRINAKYGLLLGEKDRIDNELKGWSQFLLRNKA